MPNEAAVSAGDSPAPITAPARSAWNRLRHNRRSMAALGVILLLAAMALAAGVLTPYSFQEQARGSEHATPSLKHWLGTDALGRDILCRIMYGARISMLVGFCATGMSVLIGVSVGLFAGYFGGALDAVLMRLTDTVAAFPSLLLAIAITALYQQPSVAILLAALGIVGWTAIARVVRAQVMTVKTLDYVAAARALGARNRRIMLRHVLPNCLSPLLVIATLSVGGNILGEAGLSFLGLGVQDPFPSWGGMLSDAHSDSQNYWWVIVFPGLAIVAAVLSFNLLGDGLRDALDPKS